MSRSPSPPVHEVLSKPPAYMRMSLKGRHAADHEGSCVSQWVGGVWTLHGRLVVRVSSMVVALMGHSPYRLLCRKGTCRP